MNDIKTAPKDGTEILVHTVDGLSGRPFHHSPYRARWRTERRDALIDPLYGTIIYEAWNSTGWMRAGSHFRVPGRPIGWEEV